MNPPAGDDLRADVAAAYDLVAQRESPAPEDPTPQEKPYQPDRDRERVRGRIAYGLLALIAILSGSILLLAFLGRSLDDLVKLYALVVTPLITLTGGIVGFYYGAQTKQD